MCHSGMSAVTLCKHIHEITCWVMSHLVQSIMHQQCHKVGGCCSMFTQHAIKLCTVVSLTESLSVMTQSTGATLGAAKRPDSPAPLSTLNAVTTRSPASSIAIDVVSKRAARLQPNTIAAGHRSSSASLSAVDARSRQLISAERH